MNTFKTIFLVVFCMGVFVIGQGTEAFTNDFKKVIDTIFVKDSLKYPFGVFMDQEGKLLISHDGRAISRIGKNGEAHIVAGGDRKGFAGDGELASQALFLGPGRAAFDKEGNLFVPDIGNHRIRKIHYPSGDITTVVGHGPVGRNEGSFGGDGGPGYKAFLNRPTSIAFDASGAMYIADAGNFRIRKVLPNAEGVIAGSKEETIETVAGIGKRGFTRDKKLAISARISAAVDVAVDSAGHLFIADASNNRIRRIDKDTGIITTVVGSGPYGEVAGYFGHDIAARRARLSSPEGIAFDHLGNLYIADTLNHRIRVVSPGKDKIITGETDELITTVVGSSRAQRCGPTCMPSTGGFSGDGGDPLEAKINRPQDVVIDSDGHLVIVDGLNHRVRRVTVGSLSVITPI